ncbi:MAG TPA: hypothetical protein VKH81_01330 [Candidatus Angelobacter sp.]|nr:hypothetical protein [Candidatus Angelobacter sp.]
MRRKSVILSLIGLLLGLTGIGLVVYNRYFLAPPMAAKLLPEGDLLVYANLKPLHLFDLGKSAPVEIDADYKDFIAQTGIRVERDLDSVAMSRRDTPDRSDVESSEIFVGRFDPVRLKAYLSKLSVRTGEYRGHIIFDFMHEGHYIRVCILDETKVAVTNMERADPMYGIIDGFVAKRRAGPSLLDSFYDNVPSGSLVWLIARIPNRPDNVQLPGGFTFTLPGDTTAVGSLRYTGSLLFRADVFAQSESQARQIADAANTHLALVRSIGQFVGRKGTDKDVKAAFDSIQVEQKENVATITATVPQSVLKKLWSEVQAEGAAPAVPQPKR